MGGLDALFPPEGSAARPVVFPMQPIVFIPPSESKAPGGEASFLSGHGKYRELATRRERVLAALEKAMKGKVADREDLLRAKDDALAEATAKNLAVRGAQLTLPAMERFDGVLYKNLGWSTLPESAKRSLQEHVVILDGLYGLIAPADEIPDYKLPMDAVLPDVGKLTDFWRDPLELVMKPLAAKRPVWDLLTEVPRRALPKSVEIALSVEAVEVTDGVAKSVHVSNKAFKGALLRHLAVNGFRREVVEAFAYDGFALDRERSAGPVLVFSKAVAAPPRPAKPPAPKARQAGTKPVPMAAAKAKAAPKAAKKAPAKKAKPKKA